MGIRWYVLQVLTGKEITVRNALQREHILAKVPREIFPIRRQGRWHDTEKILFPSYVFVGCETLEPDLYYMASRISGVVRFVNGSKAQPITDSEAEQLAILAPDSDPLLPSTIRIDGDELTITEGVLRQFGDNIIKIERRRRRAKVLLKFLGEEKELEFSLKPEGEINESDTIGRV